MISQLKTVETWMLDGWTDHDDLSVPSFDHETTVQARQLAAECVRVLGALTAAGASWQVKQAVLEWMVEV